MPVGTGPGKVLGTGSARGLHPGVLRASACTHPATIPGETRVSLHPHLGQWEHWAPRLHRPRCKAFGHLQRADASVVNTRFISNSPSSYANDDKTGGRPRRGVLQLLPAPEIILPYLHPLRLPERDGWREVKHENEFCGFGEFKILISP